MKKHAARTVTIRLIANLRSKMMDGMITSIYSYLAITANPRHTPVTISSTKLFDLSFSSNNRHKRKRSIIRTPSDSVRIKPPQTTWLNERARMTAPQRPTKELAKSFLRRR